MGNVRVSFGRNSAGVLEIVDANDYYPFGMNHLKTGNAFFGQGSFKNYKFLGQELQETGLYDMNARFYMPDLGRFGQHDPLSASTLDPYGYAYNNPMLFADPSGLEGDPVNGGGSGGPVTPASFGDTPGGYNGDPTLIAGAGINDVAAEQGIQEVTLTGQKSTMSKILTHPSIHSLTYGLGLTNEMPKDAVKYNPNPINTDCAYCNDKGGVMMMDGLLWDVAAIYIANNVKPENKYAAAGVGLLAIIMSRGRAADEVIEMEMDIAMAEAKAEKGAFSVANWKNYPSEIPQPKGPFRILEGAEYEAARKAANKANQAMRKANPEAYKGLEIHEIHPVKYGGSATDPTNKIAIPRDYHRKVVTPWWNENMRSIKKIP